MYRFRKPAFAKANREFESPLLRKFSKSKEIGKSGSARSADTNEFPPPDSESNLINQLVFSFAIFFEGQYTFKIGTHQLLYLGIQKRNIGFYKICKKRTRLDFGLPIFCIFGNHPFRPIERQINFFDFLLNLRSD